jgi:hypothetical protein
VTVEVGANDVAYSSACGTNASCYWNGSLSAGSGPEGAPGSTRSRSSTRRSRTSRAHHGRAYRSPA